MIIVLILLVLASLIIFYFSRENVSTVFQEQETTENQENGQDSSSEEVVFHENVSVETNSTSEGGGGSTTGIGTGAEEYVEEKVNYTISLLSEPEGLEILVNYSMAGNYSTERQYAPYSVLAESGTEACVLLTTSVKSGSVITWDIDGEDCISSLCAGFMGCGIYMDRNHVATVYYSTPD